MERKIKKESVAIVSCSSYAQKKVDKAITEALSLIDFKFKSNSTVLIKPNIVGNFPKNQIATTTNPSLIETVCKILKKHNCKIFIGDSPFTNPKDSLKASGIDKVAKKYGKSIIFEQEKLIKIRDKEASILKEFQTAKLLKDADLIINMPKLKTHTLTKYTGAIKNLYGVIPGGMKQKLHFKAQNDKKFSKLLVDIYQNIKPELTIMDGIIGMEGEGPTSGEAKKAGLILASKNGIALDIASTKIIGLKPKTVCAIEEAVKRKLYPNYKFNLVGMKKLPSIKFKQPPLAKRKNIQKVMNKMFKERPIFCDTNKCIKCRMCEKHCPAHAITLNPYPIIDKKKCIRCFCCIEICPQNALSLKK